MKLNATKLKDEFSRAARTTISMPKLLLSDAQVRQRQKRFSTFSDYVQDLIRADVRAQGRAAA